MTHNESILRSALEALADPVVLWSAEGKVAFASQSFLEAFGLRREDVEGLKEAAFAQCCLPKAGSHLGATSTVLSSPTGRQYRRCTRELPDGGQLDYFQDLNVDKAAAQRREQLLGVAIHDLRSPLANIRSYAGLLLGRMPDLDPRVRRSCEVIARNADRALKLLQLYFDSLRAETGEFDIEHQPMSLSDLVNEVVISRRAAAAEKGVEIVAAVPESMPPVSGDRDRLLSAAGAFLDHAIARSPPQAKVEVLCDDQPEQVWLGFADAGPALDPTQARLTFDRETQILKERRLGPGFAMAVARALVEMHGGRAEATSRAGHTVFAMVLPRQAVT